MKFKKGDHIKHELFDSKLEILDINTNNYILNNGEYYIYYVDDHCKLDLDYYRKEKIKKLL